MFIVVAVIAFRLTRTWTENMANYRKPVTHKSIKKREREKIAKHKSTAKRVC